MSKKAKFKLWEHVRVTNPEPTVFDKVGRITSSPDHDDFYRIIIDGYTYWIKGDGLTLADPDVHTVLDEMDAQSRVVTVGADTDNSFTVRITDPEHPAFKDITEQEIDGDYVRGLAGQLGVSLEDGEVFTRNVKQLSEPDPVNHPAHYGGDTTYETIKVIEAWGLGFSIGNCVKYLSRAGKKGPALEDLRKARFYLDREITRAEAAQ